MNSLNNLSAVQLNLQNIYDIANTKGIKRKYTLNYYLEELTPFYTTAQVKEESTNNTIDYLYVLYYDETDKKYYHVSKTDNKLNNLQSFNAGYSTVYTGEDVISRIGDIDILTINIPEPTSTSQVKRFFINGKGITFSSDMSFEELNDVYKTYKNTEYALNILKTHKTLLYKGKVYPKIYSNEAPLFLIRDPDGRGTYYNITAT